MLAEKHPGAPLQPPGEGTLHLAELFLAHHPSGRCDTRVRTPCPLLIISTSPGLYFFALRLHCSPFDTCDFTGYVTSIGSFEVFLQISSS
eukprot:g10844.t1